MEGKREYGSRRTGCQTVPYRIRTKRNWRVYPFGRFASLFLFPFCSFFFFSFFGRSTRRRRANKRPRHSFLARETLVFPGQTRRETQTISPSVHAVNARNWNRRLKYKIFIGDVKVQKIEKFYNMACKLLFVYFT